MTLSPIARTTLKGLSQTDAIAVFDSGIGGINVLRALRRLLPHETLHYVADTAYAPYGNKSVAEVQARCLNICDFFLTLPVKAIVVACNTASAAAVAQLRERYHIPIVAMEPGIKPAAKLTRTGVVAVLATAGTLGSPPFARLAQQYAQDIRLIAQPCPGLVERIEAGDFDSPALRRLLHNYIAPLLEQGIDTLVLGCTHYPFVAPLIQEMIGASINLIDTSEAVARQTQRRLAEAQLLRLEQASAATHFWTSGEVNGGRRLLARLWPGDIELRSMPESLHSIELQQQ